MRIIISIWLLLNSFIIFGQSTPQILEICSGSSAVLKANPVTQADAAGGYIWFRDGQMVGTSATLTDSIVITDPGSYTLVCINAAGCSSNISDPIQVNHKQLKAVNDFANTYAGASAMINIVNNDVEACAPIDINLTNINTYPSFGSLSMVNPGVYNYTPFFGFSGLDSFEYIITDNLGNTSKAKVFITVRENSPLPVQLSSFTASKLNEQQALLEWRTASEINSEAFIIERSADGRKFEAIGRVAAAGNSSHPLDYRFIDTLPLAGNNLYRLKLMDIDGTSSYSSVEMLHFTIKDEIHIFPNPVAGTLYIKLGQVIPQRIQVVDLSGKVMLDMKPETNSIELDMHHYVAGAYFVRVLSKDNKWHTHKIVKQ